MARKRVFDAVVFGVTGFTGRLVGEYMARAAPPNVRWAIAGRSRPKLENSKRELEDLARMSGTGSIDVGLIVADSSDPASLDELARQSKVVISTVGPFSKYGEPLVAACVRNRTDYIDSTGETSWVADMIAKYQDEAKANGVFLVPSCGFDSIPSDLGTWMVVDHARRRHDTALARVDGLFTVKGGASGGTLASIAGLMNFSGVKKLMNKRLLCPSDVEGRPIKEVVAGSDAPPYPTWHKERGVWTAPFLMAGANTRVVRRSAALYAGLPTQSYSLPGTPFSYKESQAANTFKVAALISLVMLFGPLIFFSLMVIPCTRCAVTRFLPKPGTGPSASQRAKSWFVTELYGYPADPSLPPIVGRVAGKDPGYDETAKMLAESAMTMAFDRAVLPAHHFGGGFLTPATAFGQHLIRRLRAAGLTFEIVEK